jgi:hypothetical protein
VVRNNPTRQHTHQRLLPGRGSGRGPTLILSAFAVSPWFGGRCVLGFQIIGQMRGTYGNTETQTIVENCGNTLILRCSASERGGTAEFASRLYFPMILPRRKRLTKRRILLRYNRRRRGLKAIVPCWTCQPESIG